MNRYPQVTVSSPDQPQPIAPDRKPRAWVAIIVCGVLAVVSYAISAFAVLTKSPTADEPYHFAAAYTHVFEHDFRVDPEDPPLWSWLAMLPIGRDRETQAALHAAMSSPDAMTLWAQITRDPTVQWPWMDKVMFQSPGVDAPALVNRSRLAMAVLAPLIVLAACACAWRLAGAAAAVVVGVLLALDPLLLGHAPLVKNDAAITLVTLALAAAVVNAMRRGSAWSLLALVLCSAVAVIVKFSGILLVGLAIIALTIRALRGEPWQVLGRTLLSRLNRLAAVAGCALVILAACWLSIWTVYGFRFAPTAGAPVTFDEQWFTYQMQGRSFVARHQRPPREAELATAPVGPVVSAAVWLNDHHLLPNAYCMGFIFMHASSQSRNGFLLGEVRNTGWWYYFPLAMLFKTPTASIVAVLGAAIALFTLPALRPSRWQDRPLTRHALVCFMVLGGGYMLVAMSSNLNLGVRHVMPIYPLLYIGTGVVFARMRNAKPRAAGWIAAILGLGLAIETLAAFPNYIAFFNAPSGGSRGGIRLLGDSNLDWGQDLPLLADWQAKHSGVPLYLSYFGAVDPDAYGIDHINIGGTANNPSRRPTGHFANPGVFAVSATQLQGIYVVPGATQSYAALRKLRPREVLGGTIYLFDYPFATSRPTVTTAP